MSEVRRLRALLEPRVPGDVLVLFESTIAEYEAELRRLKEENERKQRLLEAAWNPRVLLRKADFQLLNVVKEVPSEEQDWTSSPDQDNPESGSGNHIKKDQEGELCQCMDEAGLTKVPSTSVHLKTEDKDVETQSSPLHQTQTEKNQAEPDGEDCGGSEQASRVKADGGFESPIDDEDCEENQTPSREPEGLLNENPQPQDKRSTEPMGAEAETEDCPGSETAKGSGLDPGSQQSDDDQTEDLGDGDEEWTPRRVKKTKRLSRSSTEPMETEAEMEDCPGVETAKGSGLDPGSQQSDDDQTEDVGDGDEEWTPSKDKKTKYPSRSSTEPIEAEANGEDDGESEPTRSEDSGTHSQENTVDQPEDSSNTDDDEWKPSSNGEESSGSESDSNEQMTVKHMKIGAESMSRRSTDNKNSEKKGYLDITNSLFCNCDDNDSSNKATNTPKTKRSNGLPRKREVKKPYSCCECGKAFVGRTHLEIHMRVHTGEKPFQCPICQKRFKYESNLKVHITSHSTDKPVKCSICGSGFTREAGLRAHMKGHRGEKPFSCSVCQKSFRDKSNLRRHMKIHTGEKTFGCSVCGVKFTRRSGLAEHLTLHTQKREKPFSCSVCQRRFTHKSNLRRHLVSHTGQKLFSCEVCDARFSHKSHIRNHMVRHSAVKPFSCSVCNKTFTREIHVKAHMIAHSGKKLFKCSICGAGFPLRTSVRDHMMMSHTENRPFKCSFCTKAFKRKCHLERHVAIHNGEQPFHCSVCQQRFSQKSHLTTHMLCHTEKQLFSCSVCHKNFSRSWSVKIHMRFHKDAPDSAVGDAQR